MSGNASAIASRETSRETAPEISRDISTPYPPASTSPMYWSSLERIFGRILELARQRLGMDIAWVSEFTNGDQVLRAVRGEAESFGVDIGFCSPYESSYCSRVVTGQLPNLIPDAAADPRTRDLPITAQLDIGSYVGVPVVLDDGAVYGMLCCLGHGPTGSLGEKDVRFLRLLAQVIAEEVEHGRGELERHREQRTRIEAATRGHGLKIVFQPIVGLHSSGLLGMEALARFPGGRSPDVWFREAGELGVGVELELAALRIALAQVDELPPHVYLSLNVSPPALSTDALGNLLTPHGSRIALEVTEHALVDDYEALLRAVRPLRASGVRLAVDDAGAGYASLRHILHLQPEIIKLDMSLTRDIQRDHARQALASGLVHFTGRLGATLVAEGVETTEEVDALRTLGVPAAQGYLIARPGPLDALQDFLRPCAQPLERQTATAAVRERRL